MNLLKQLQSRPVANEAKSTARQPLNNPKSAEIPAEGPQIPPAAGGEQPLQSNIKYLFQATKKEQITIQISISNPSSCLELNLSVFPVSNPNMEFVGTVMSTKTAKYLHGKQVINVKNDNVRVKPGCIFV